MIRSCKTGGKHMVKSYFTDTLNLKNRAASRLKLHECSNLGVVYWVKVYKRIKICILSLDRHQTSYLPKLNALNLT